MEERKNKIDALLNVSTPYAPVDDDEVQARIKENTDSIEPSVYAEAPQNDSFRLEDSRSPSATDSKATVNSAVAALPKADRLGNPLFSVAASDREIDVHRPDDSPGDQWFNRLEDRMSDALARLESFESSVAEISVTCADPDELVTATVDGLDNILQLQFSPQAARTRRALGPLATETLARAREKAAQAKASLSENDYRDLPDLARVRELLHKPAAVSARVDPRSRAFDDGLRELFDALRILGEEHKNRRVEQEMAHDLGSVSANLDGSHIVVDIVSSALRHGRFSMLGEAVIEAIDKLIDRSANIVDQEFIEVQKTHERRMM